MTHARVALLVSLALMAIAGAWTLARAPLRVVRVGVRPDATLASAANITPTVCQSEAMLPAHVSAIRLGVEASFGPKVLVRLYSDSRILTAGDRTPGWTASSVTVPVRPLRQSHSHVKLCFAIPANGGFLQLYGVPTALQQAAVGDAGQRLPGKVSVAYLGPGSGSWWSRASAVARHIGVGHAITGTWVALFLAALVAAVAALMIGLAWRELP